jgi:MFS superfamily sulfate permease-like transporter
MARAKAKAVFIIVPFTQTIQDYHRLRSRLFTAGKQSIRRLVIPLKIGYTQVAGLPATMWLYAAIIPLVLCERIA